MQASILLVAFVSRVTYRKCLEKLLRILKVFSPRANHLLSPSSINLASRQLHLLGRSASHTRIRNRCLITGRPRGVLKSYGLSRLEFKRLAHLGYISGIKKSS